MHMTTELPVGFEYRKAARGEAGGFGAEVLRVS